MQEAANQGGLTAHEVEDAKTFEDEPPSKSAAPKSNQADKGRKRATGLTG
jgi:hypothetical protein